MRSMIVFILSLILGLIVGVLSGALAGLGIAAWIASEIKKDEDNQKFGQPGSIHYRGGKRVPEPVPEAEDEPTPAA